MCFKNVNSYIFGWHDPLFIGNQISKIMVVLNGQAYGKNMLVIHKLTVEIVMLVCDAWDWEMWSLELLTTTEVYLFEIW